MPYGGLQIYASGMRLQPVTPGQNDPGNFRVTGTGIAKLFGTSTNHPGFSREVFGIGAACLADSSCVFGNAANISATSGSALIAIGSGAQIQGNGAGSGIMIGSGSKIWGASSERNILIGTSSTLGGAPGTLDNVVMGTLITCGVTQFTTLIGSQCSNGTGLRNTAIGAQCGAGNYDDCVLVGRGTTATQSFHIKIGSSSHTKIEIGPYDFSSGYAATARTIADANATITASDSMLQYSSITAARTVALPAANAVPKGYRVMVVDVSGAASAGNTITINRAGADTINGAASRVINAAYGYTELVSDGASKWTVIR